LQEFETVVLQFVTFLLEFVTVFLECTESALISCVCKLELAQTQDFKPFSSEYSLQPMKTVIQISLAAPFSSEYSLKSCVSYLDLRFVLTLARITVWLQFSVRNLCFTFGRSKTEKDRLITQNVSDNVVCNKILKNMDGSLILKGQKLLSSFAI